MPGDIMKGQVFVVGPLADAQGNLPLKPLGPKDAVLFAGGEISAKILYATIGDVAIIGTKDDVSAAFAVDYAHPGESGGKTVYKLQAEKKGVKDHPADVRFDFLATKAKFVWNDPGTPVNATFAYVVDRGKMGATTEEVIKAAKKLLKEVGVPEGTATSVLAALALGNLAGALAGLVAGATMVIALKVVTSMFGEDAVMTATVPLHHDVAGQQRVKLCYGTFMPQGSVRGGPTAEDFVVRASDHHVLRRKTLEDVKEDGAYAVVELHG